MQSPRRFSEEDFKQFKKRQEGILKTFVEVKLKKASNFNIIRELLTRIGIQYPEQNTLRQSCFIFQKRGRYYIVHFKELYNLDGKLDKAVSEFDEGIRNAVVIHIEKAGLISVLTEDNLNRDHLENITELDSTTAASWKLVPMYKFKVIITGDKQKGEPNNG